MTMILTKIQFSKTAASSVDLTSGSSPVYHKDGRTFLKGTHEEVAIVEEESFTLEDLANQRLEISK